MKLEELSKQDLILMIKSLYNRNRLMSIDLEKPNEVDYLEKEQLIKEYISDILIHGIDDVILKNAGHDFD